MDVLYYFRFSLETKYLCTYIFFLELEKSMIVTTEKAVDARLFQFREYMNVLAGWVSSLDKEMLPSSGRRF
jgi:hypothetical protein